MESNLEWAAISKYQNVNESLNSKFDLANYAYGLPTVGYTHHEHGNDEDIIFVKSKSCEIQLYITYLTAYLLTHWFSNTTAVQHTSKITNLG